ncbi:hypothetical protein B0H14DRAFT_2618837 [Mycena olivaceomarginata]|nr:hypothetical protein B0H14DRAFT_2618837 [Mycena olivaceomarginata]
MFQRKVYLKHPGTKFWDKLDLRLAKIRKEADGDSKKITKVFRHILDKDQKKHGKNDTVFNEMAVDEVQQGVDNLIDIGVINVATFLPASHGSMVSATLLQNGGVPALWGMLAFLVASLSELLAGVYLTSTASVLVSSNFQKKEYTSYSDLIGRSARHGTLS